MNFPPSFLVEVDGANMQVRLTCSIMWLTYLTKINGKQIKLSGHLKFLPWHATCCLQNGTKDLM